MDNKSNLRLNICRLIILSQIFSSSYPAFAAVINQSSSPPPKICPCEPSLPSLGSDKNIKSEAGGWSEKNKTLAKNLAQAGGIASNSDSNRANQVVSGMLSSTVNTEIGNWLNQFGTARVQLGVGSGSANNSSVDYLQPIYDDKKTLLFSQLGYRNKNDRDTINIGAGYRIFNEKWMFGNNLFFDNDITGKNYRFGIGAEGASDYLNASINYYHGLSSWQQSKSLNDYMERPADGWDARVQGWLPMYPQLGGKIVYEKYYGHNVDLFGKDNLQKDPYAVSLGLNWSPFPLLTLGVEQKMGKDRLSETSADIQFSIYLDKNFSQHFDSSEVNPLRLLNGNRYNLVDRNNSIVLDHKKQDIIKMTLPSYFYGQTRQTLDVTANVKSKYSLSEIKWDAPQFISAGGSLGGRNGRSLKLYLPDHPGVYPLTGIAIDVKGNSSNSITTFISVSDLPISASLTSMVITPQSIPADGTSQAKIVLYLNDKKGLPVSNQSNLLLLTLKSGQKQNSTRTLAGKINQQSQITGFKETASGVYEATLTSGTSPGDHSVIATWNGSEIARTQFSLTVAGNSIAIPSALSVLRDGALADGLATNEISVRVTDGQGNPLAGQTVSLTAGNGAVIAGTATSGTDGTATATLTSTRAGTATVTATLNGVSRNIDTTFVADEASAVLLGVKIYSDHSFAGQNQVNWVEASVVDSDGNPVKGVNVTYSVSNNASFNGGNIKETDSDGHSYAAVMAPTPGQYIVTATLKNGSSKSVTLNFTTDLTTIAANDLIVEKNGAVANGVDTNNIRVRVTGNNGQPINNKTIVFKADNGARITSPATTASDGWAAATVRNTLSGVSKITITLPNGFSREIDTLFIADNLSANINIDDIVTINDNALSDGVAENRVSVLVKDSNGNIISGERVEFTATNGVNTTETTDTNGRAYMNLSNKYPGVIKITATLSNSKSLSTRVTFTGTAIIEAGNIEVLDDGAKANDWEKNRIRVKVTNEQGRGLSHQTVYFSATNGAMLQNAAITDDDGTAEITLTNKTAGVSTVTASIGSSIQMINTVFLPDGKYPEIKSLLVDNFYSFANGIDSNNVRVIVSDSYGNALSGQHVTFTASNGNSTIATTGSDGAAEWIIYNSPSTNVTVKAILDNGLQRSLSVRFATNNKISVSIVKNNAKADGVEENIIKVKVVNQLGQPQSDQFINIAASHSFASFPPKVKTGPDGTVDIPITSTYGGDTLGVIVGLDDNNRGDSTTLTFTN